MQIFPNLKRVIILLKFASVAITNKPTFDTIFPRLANLFRYFPGSPYRCRPRSGLMMPHTGNFFPFEKLLCLAQSDSFPSGIERKQAKFINSRYFYTCPYILLRYKLFTGFFFDCFCDSLGIRSFVSVRSPLPEIFS